MPAKKPDLSSITGFTHLWGEKEHQRAKRIVEHASLLTQVHHMETSLRHSPARSTLVIGAPGIGKTAHILSLYRRLRSRGWMVFEATASDVMAGQIFIGQIDERVRELVSATRDARTVLWVCPAFHELLWMGRYQQNPVGLLELLVPHIESGAIRVIGETTPAAYEVMTQAVPKVKTILDAVRVSPMDDAEALEIAQTWAAREKGPAMETSLLVEAAHLAGQFLSNREQPGRLLDLLGATRERVSAATSTAAPLILDDIIDTLSQRTGIPEALLDDRKHLNLDTVRSFFSERVLGQPEAVDTIVDRIALVKAGLTDPTRPQGVFLLVGPTGTGKTELAKTLAQYLFGSAERLIRLDMSELQGPGAVEQVLGENNQANDANTLVSKIRQQPFSVVLLDEFEKAHPALWDLFLQVFDDGRLTDRNGRTADFRSAIIVMTSNLGAVQAGSAGMGFERTVAGFTPSTISRTLERTFRPEFLNRIDRIVTFRPLSRPVMRRLLHLELRNVFERRGLRRRGWAVEWDEAALEYLLDHGFSPSLGARPLKRSVEQLFLAPLARAIVEHRAPEGEQFLFIRCDGDALQVEFVDPDAAPPAPLLSQPEDKHKPDALETIALAGVGTEQELSALHTAYEGLQAVLGDEAWIQAKTNRLQAMSDATFWERPDRYTTLGEAEYMDRIEAGLEAAGSLLNRLERVGDTGRPPTDLVRKVAEKLYLVGAAFEEVGKEGVGAVFVMVTAARDPAVDAAEQDAFALRIGRMYRQWAARRRMRLLVLEEGQVGTAPYREVLAFSGLGALHILSGEAGQHVLEIPRSESGFRRIRATVTVAAQPPSPLPRDNKKILQIALNTLSAGPAAIVRHYREKPSPLVRDLAHGWRSGHLELIFNGDFDLFV